MTKTPIIFIILSFIVQFTIGQNRTINLQIDSLKYLRQQPFDCNSVYWRLVSTGKEAIPFLIDKLDDTTCTQTSLTCKKKDVRLGDICFEALTEIFNIPLFYITKQQFDFIDQYGCQQGVFTYLDNNRQRFKAQVFDYYYKYKAEIQFIKYDKDYKNDCKSRNKIFGYYNVDFKRLHSS